MMNKRLVGIIAIIVAISFVVVIAVVIPKVGEQTRLNNMIWKVRNSQIRNGEGIIEAAEYSPSTPGPHRIVIFADPKVEDTSEFIPQEWLAGSIEEVELVVFIFHHDKELVPCDYWGGYSLKRIQVYYVVELWVAKTGTLLKNETFYGIAPRCPETRKFTGFVETVYGFAPLKDVKTWLEPHVMGEGTKTTTSILIRNTTRPFFL